MDKLQEKKVAILVTDGFEQVELTEPQKALEREGAITHIVSPKKGKVKAWNHKEWGNEFEVDITLDETKADHYDALLLPGGVMNPDQLRMNKKAVEFVSKFFRSNKPVAAICHGPWLLIETGELQGRNITSYRSLKTDLENAGATWLDKETVIDGNLLTSRNPGDLPAFNKKLTEIIYHESPVTEEA